MCIRDRFKEYLRTMSKFYNYSFNNTLLIAMQKPEEMCIRDSLNRLIKEIVVHEHIDSDKTRHISIEIHFNLKPI